MKKVLGIICLVLSCIILSPLYVYALGKTPEVCFKVERKAEYGQAKSINGYKEINSMSDFMEKYPEYVVEEIETAIPFDSFTVGEDRFSTEAWKNRDLLGQIEEFAKVCDTEVNDYIYAPGEFTLEELTRINYRNGRVYGGYVFEREGKPVAAIWFADEMFEEGTLTVYADQIHYDELEISINIDYNCIQKMQRDMEGIQTEQVTLRQEE